MIAVFSDFVGGTPCEIALKPGEIFTDSGGRLTADGWERHHVTWTHVGHRIEREWTTDTRDTDGRRIRLCVSVCELDQLNTGFPWGGTLSSPIWRRVREREHGRVRRSCEFAEAQA